MVVQLPREVVYEIISFIPKDNTVESPVSDLIKPYIVRYNRLRNKKRLRFSTYMICPDYVDNQDSDDGDYDV